MLHYKGLNVWWNSLQGKYFVQEGFSVLGSYSTIGGAKSAITQKWSKC